VREPPSAEGFRPPSGIHLFGDQVAALAARPRPIRESGLRPRARGSPREGALRARAGFGGGRAASRATVRFTRTPSSPEGFRPPSRFHLSATTSPPSRRSRANPRSGLPPQAGRRGAAVPIRDAALPAAGRPSRRSRAFRTAAFRPQAGPRGAAAPSNLRLEILDSAAQPCPQIDFGLPPQQRSCPRDVRAPDLWIVLR
jgi:hypothetical protein